MDNFYIAGFFGEIENSSPVSSSRPGRMDAGLLAGLGLSRPLRQDLLVVVDPDDNRLNHSHYGLRLGVRYVFNSKGKGF